MEGMGHLTVPNSVVTIERSAFQSMDNLVSVVIGDSVENLGQLYSLFRIALEE